MKPFLFFIPLLGVALSSCSMVNESMQALQNNRDAIDMSTCAIDANTQAIEEANRGIEVNRQKLEQINNTLKKVEKS